MGVAEGDLWVIATEAFDAAAEVCDRALFLGMAGIDLTISM